MVAEFSPFVLAGAEGGKLEILINTKLNLAQTRSSQMKLNSTHEENVTRKGVKSISINAAMSYVAYVFFLCCETKRSQRVAGSSLARVVSYSVRGH